MKCRFRINLIAAADTASTECVCTGKACSHPETECLFLTRSCRPACDPLQCYPEPICGNVGNNLPGPFQGRFHKQRHLLDLQGIHPKAPDQIRLAGNVQLPVSFPGIPLQHHGRYKAEDAPFKHFSENEFGLIAGKGSVLKIDIRHFRERSDPALMAPGKCRQHISLRPARHILRYQFNSLHICLVRTPGLETPVPQRVSKSLPKKSLPAHKILHRFHQRFAVPVMYQSDGKDPSHGCFHGFRQIKLQFRDTPVP